MLATGPRPDGHGWRHSARPPENNGSGGYRQEWSDSATALTSQARAPRLGSACRYKPLIDQSRNCSVGSVACRRQKGAHRGEASTA